MFETVNFNKNETLKLRFSREKETNWNLEQLKEKVLVTLFVYFFQLPEFLAAEQKRL